jgi:hypothetical protein
MGITKWSIWVLTPSRNRRCADKCCAGHGRHQHSRPQQHGPLYGTSGRCYRSEARRWPCRGGRCPFKEAREYARKLNLKSHEEWEALAKDRSVANKNRLPNDIPSYPNNVYDEWIGWWDPAGPPQLKLTHWPTDCAQLGLEARSGVLPKTVVRSLTPAARSFCADVRRFGYVTNEDGVLGPHSPPTKGTPMPSRRSKLSVHCRSSSTSAAEALYKLSSGCCLQ